MTLENLNDLRKLRKMTESQIFFGGRAQPSA